ncbi:fluoride efflux transporter CrcB [Haloferula rosea]|uniref:Fluoride-specific ion channel FluC n=1 Tax=Haloferula rosea TaxID=490093 RepID=A0A934RGL9_9BACT|nr:fluoride efflux transporter CrcB [Haloferula rosea]MBK1828804.1 fluoride efflux transporter CrcB [Haloferula rosea]
MPPALLIFLGGGLGAISRWGLSMVVENFTEKTELHRFPWGILACNLAGCFLIGIVFGAVVGRHHPGWLFPFLVTGFLGGFTTFSTFGNDSRQLLMEGFHIAAFTNVLVSTLGGIALVFIGFRLAHSLSQ